MSNVAMTIERKITVGTVLTAIVLIVSVVTWSSNIHADADKRIALIEQEMKEVREMRQDIRDIRDVTVLLPSYMKQKDAEDEKQWKAIENLAITEG